MQFIPTNPAQRCVAAITGRLSNVTNGFNVFLSLCLGGSNLSPFAIDFSRDSPTFLRGKYDIQELFDSEEINLPAIALCQGPSRMAPVRDRLVGSVFSGSIGFGLDLHLMSTEGQSQTDFDAMVSCCHDAMVNTFNVAGAAEYPTLQLVWDGDISMAQPSRIYDGETATYLSTLPFRLTLYAPV